MSLEDEHETMHRRGEMVKFMLFVLTLVGAVLLIALLRPFVFDRVVPAVLGLDREPEAALLATPDPGAGPADTEAGAQPTATEEAPLRIMTATPPAVETLGGGAAEPTARLYEVQRGDTLVAIAERFGVSLPDLVQANSIANPNRIQPGDMLVIPAP